MANDLVKKDFEEQKELIKSLYCRNLTPAEIEHFFVICKNRNLNPMLNQIYVWKVGGKMVTIVSIDGFRLIAERTKEYAPGRETIFAYKENGGLLSATAYVKKLTKDGVWHEVSAIAFWDEYNESSKPMWKKMSHVMISKCAEAQALRRAFPSDLSGLYAPEEMDQAIQDVVVEEVKEENTPQMSVNEAVEVISLAFAIADTKSLQKYIETRMENSSFRLHDVVNKWLEKKDKFLEYFSSWKEKQVSKE